MYKLAPNNDGLIRLTDNAFIAAGTEDTERDAWLAAGNVPTAADPLPTPTVIDMRQARLALLQSGLLARVDAAVASMPGIEGDTARIEWEFASLVERSNPLVQSLSSSLGLTETQLDDLFELAGSL